MASRCVYVGQPFAVLRQALSQNAALGTGLRVAPASPCHRGPLQPRCYRPGGICASRSLLHCSVDGGAKREVRPRVGAAPNQPQTDPRVESPLSHVRAVASFVCSFFKPGQLGLLVAPRCGARGCTKRCEVFQWFLLPPLRGSVDLCSRARAWVCRIPARPWAEVVGRVSLRVDAGRSVLCGRAKACTGLFLRASASSPRVRVRRDLCGCKMPLKRLLGQV